MQTDQRFWPTTPNIRGRYMSRSFAHPVACYCMLLSVVGSCCAKFETGRTFIYVQTDATTPNIVGPTMLGVFIEVLVKFN